MSTPKASIIIATYKRPDLIARCLDRLAPGMQTASSQDYEVIVADDDPQRSAIPVLQENYPWVILAYGPSKGPSGARNTAAAFAKAPLLIFTDDDCIPGSEWVESYLKAHQPHQVMVGKTTCTDGCHDPFDHAPVNLDGAVRFGCNLAIERDIFQRMGGFDEGYLKYGFEDYDFFTRCDMRGMKSLFVPNAIIDHPARRNPSANRRILTKINQYRYNLKFGESPSLSEGLRVNFAFARQALRRKAPLHRRLIYLFDFIWYVILSIAYHDRFIQAARRSLGHSSAIL